MVVREPELPTGRTGVYSATRLLRAGWRRSDIRRAVSRKRLLALRRGWYAVHGADPEVARAVAAGGTLTCVSALSHHGLWVPPDERTLHVRLPERARGRQAPLGVHFCRPAGDRALRSGFTAVDQLAVTLLAVARCVTSEMFVAVLDSALHRAGLSTSDLAAMLDDAPSRIRRLVERCDVAESGTESLVRVRLRSRNVKVRPQVTIPTVGRVDFLVGKRLVIEVDSRAHHTSSVAYRNDRRRDRRLVALGYVVVRLTYEDVLYHWAEVEADLFAIIRTRVHLAEPVPGPELAKAA